MFIRTYFNNAPKCETLFLMLESERFWREFLEFSGLLSVGDTWPYKFVTSLKNDPTPKCGEGANENKFSRLECIACTQNLFCQWIIGERHLGNFSTESFISPGPFSLVYILTSYSGSVRTEKNDDAVYFSCLHTKWRHPEMFFSFFFLPVKR